MPSSKRKSFFCARLDFLGKKPTLLVSGHSRQRTVLGGMCSVSVLLLITLFTAQRFKQLILDEMPSIVNIRSPVDLTKTSHFFEPSSVSWDVAVAFKNVESGELVELDPKVGSFNFV